MLAPCWPDEFGALEEVSQVSCQAVTKQQVWEFKAKSQLEPRPARGQGTRDEEVLTHVDGLKFEHSGSALRRQQGVRQWASGPTLLPAAKQEILASLLPCPLRSPSLISSALVPHDPS